MSVIAAFKFNNVLALGVGPCEADGCHGRFRARTDEANFLHVRKSGDDQFREIGFGGSGRAEAGAVAGRGNNSFDHGGGGVAQDQRSPGADVVHVLVAVGVPDVGALAAHDVNRIAAHGAEGPHGGVHSARN